MLRDRHGTPSSLPAYFLATALAMVAAWWSEHGGVDATAVVIAVASALGAAAVLFGAGHAHRAVHLILTVLAWLRTAATAHRPVPPTPKSLEPIDTAAYLRVVSVSEPRATTRAA